MMLVDDPATRAEVESAFAAYERALMDNDVAGLNRFFWQSALVVRFGPGQNLYGIEAIAAFRAARVGGSPRRVLRETRIATFGADFAVATTEFQREGGVPPGRQSQTWVRFAEGWRIVSAHVSLLAEGA